MVTPLDAVPSFHRALRNDMREIDDAAYEAAAGDGNLSPAMEQLRFFSEILKWHADGEEELVFPAMDRVAPLAAKAYFNDRDYGVELAFQLYDEFDLLRALGSYGLGLVEAEGPDLLGGIKYFTDAKPIDGCVFYVGKGIQATLHPALAPSSAERVALTTPRVSTTIAVVRDSPGQGGEPFHIDNPGLECAVYKGTIHSQRQSWTGGTEWPSRSIWSPSGALLSWWI